MKPMKICNSEKDNFSEKKNIFKQKKSSKILIFAIYVA